MSNIYKTLLGTIACILSVVSFAESANTQVYSWRSETGSVVFSEKKPKNDVDYKTIEVEEPTIVDTKTPKDSDGGDVKISQSDVEKLANSQLAEQNKQVLEEGKTNELEVQITSPSPNMSVFSKEDKLAVRTDPEIPSTANPTFRIDGKPVPATFENGGWQIPRPKAGENKLQISGKTAEGNNISSNEITFYVKNGWIQQAKNTGNYRGR